MVCDHDLRVLKILVIREGELQGEYWCIALWVADGYIRQMLQRRNIALQDVRANVGVGENLQPELLDSYCFPL